MERGGPKGGNDQEGKNLFTGSARVYTHRNGEGGGEGENIQLKIAVESTSSVLIVAGQVGWKAKPNNLYDVFWWVVNSSCAQ